MDYAEHQFKLVKPDKDGHTQKAHLEQLQKQMGKKLPELEGPPFPSEVGFIWEAFLQLNDSRTMGTASANPIPYEAIKAFMEITYTVLSPRDIAVIKDLDKLYLKVMNDNG